MRGMFAGSASDTASSTGAASGPLGAYLVRYGIVPASPEAYIVSEQGIEIGRPSLIHIRIERRGDEAQGVHVRDSGRK